MTPFAKTMLVIAEELAAQARSSMPKLLDGEQVIGEQFENGIYTRKSILGGTVFLSQYDFRQKAVRRIEDGEGGIWQRLT